MKKSSERATELINELSSGPEVPVAALATNNRIATVLGVAQNTVANWAYRYDDFPRPLNALGTPIYDLRDVIEWWAQCPAKLSGRINGH